MKSSPRLNSDMVAEVMTQGRAVKSASFLFKYVEISNTRPKNKTFFGFISSKKNFPTAVERSRARRRGRAALQRALKGPAELRKSIYGAFVLGKEAAAVDMNLFVEEIQQVLFKSGILVKQ